jgi:hypothetical protein
VTILHVCVQQRVCAVVRVRDTPTRRKYVPFTYMWVSFFLISFSSLSLSFFSTHTHTHTNTHFMEPFLHFSPRFCFSHSSTKTTTWTFLTGWSKNLSLRRRLHWIIKRPFLVQFYTNTHTCTHTYTHVWSCS